MNKRFRAVYGWMLYAVLTFTCAVAISPAGAQPRSAPDLHTVSDREDLIRFEMPQYWVSDSEEDGIDLFYHDVPASGTLRVAVTVFQAYDGSEPITSLHDFSPVFSENRYYASAAGDSIQESVDTVVEDHVPIVMTRFRTLHHPGPRMICIALFTWTVEPAAASSVENAASLKFIREAVHKAVFNGERLQRMMDEGTHESQRRSRR